MKLKGKEKGNVSDLSNAREQSNENETKPIQETTGEKSTMEVSTVAKEEDNREDRVGVSTRERSELQGRGGEGEDNNNKQVDSKVRSDEGSTDVNVETRREQRRGDKGLLSINKNYYITDEDVLYEGGQKTKANNNIKAIEIGLYTTYEE